MNSIARSLRFVSRPHWKQRLAVCISLLSATVLPTSRLSAQSYSDPSTALNYSSDAVDGEAYSTSAMELEVARLEATNQAMLKSVSDAKQTVAISSGIQNEPPQSRQVAYQTGVPQLGTLPSASIDPTMSTELAELKSQVESQRFEMASLQSQIKLRDVELNHAAPRLFLTYESLLLQPMQSNNSGVIVETPTGYSTVGFPWRMEYSPRIQFGRAVVGDDFGWRVRYWNFDHHQSFTANNANGLIPTGNEGTVGYLSEDGDITTGLAFITAGTFHSNVRADVLDLEMQRNIAALLNLYAGLRYAKLAQHYNAVTDQGTANAYSEFRGVGPTVALAFNHQMALNRLSAFANARGSLLMGHKEFGVVDNVNNRTQSLGTIDLRSFDDGANTLVSNAEMQVGVRFTGDWYALSVAMDAQYFDNVGGPNPPAVFTGPDSGLTADSPLDDALGFVGLSVGSEFYW